MKQTLSAPFPTGNGVKTNPAPSPRLKGLIAAPFTAMHSDFSLNLPMVARQVKHLQESGVSGAFICGTTGEGLSLTLEERMALAEEWSSSAERLKIIVHTGHVCTEDAKNLARHANKLPVHATAALAPCFFRPTSLNALVSYCEELALSAPDLPFYYYHIPAMTGVNFAIADFLEAAKDRIPNLAGVKFTYENLMDYAEARTVAGARYDILFGRDEILLSSLALGAEGAVGSTYNYAGPIYLKMMRHFEAGDLSGAQKLQAFANQAISIMIKHGGMGANKAIMAMVGVDCGPVRLPLEPLTPAQYKAMYGELENIGFFTMLEQTRASLSLADGTRQVAAAWR